MRELVTGQTVCAKQAWRFVQGGSPCQERRNQARKGSPDTGLGRSLRRAGRRTIGRTTSEEVGRGAGRG